MERERFGDLVTQVLRNLKEYMQINLDNMEGVLDLAKYPYWDDLVNATSPSISPEQDSSARAKNPHEGGTSTVMGVR